MPGSPNRILSLLQPEPSQTSREECVPGAEGPSQASLERQAKSNRCQSPHCQAKPRQGVGEVTRARAPGGEGGLRSGGAMGPRRLCAR